MQRTVSTADMRQMREDAAVQAAAQLFLQRGIGAVKMTDIAQATGIGVASLYRYFTTKTNLVVAAGTLLWREFRTRFAQIKPVPVQKNGLAQMKVLLDRYGDTFSEHAEFISFLDDFDHVMLEEHVDRDLLAEYDRQVALFRTVYLHAFEAGVADGSIRGDIDFDLFYQSTAHALMGVAQKLIRGEILPSDDFSHGRRELDCIVDMAIDYLENGRA